MTAYLDALALRLRGDRRLVFPARVDRAEDAPASMWLWTHDREQALSLVREVAVEAFAAGADVICGRGRCEDDIAKFYLRLEASS
jgi:hypothetical protein